LRGVLVVKVWYWRWLLLEKVDLERIEEMGFFKSMNMKENGFKLY